MLSKLLLNAFGPQTQTKTVTAQQYSQWTARLGTTGRCVWLSARRSAWTRWRWCGTRGNAQAVGTDFRKTICAADFRIWKNELVRRMELREVLKDSRRQQAVAVHCTCGTASADKSNLSGVALENAKADPRVCRSAR